LERQAGLDIHTSITSEIAQKAYEIFSKSWNWSKNVRALGVRVTDLVESDTCTQISLFSDDIKRQSLRYLMSVWTGSGRDLDIIR